jgi:hypothetical protein
VQGCCSIRSLICTGQSLGSRERDAGRGQSLELIAESNDYFRSAGFNWMEKTRRKRSR